MVEPIINSPMRRKDLKTPWHVGVEVYVYTVCWQEPPYVFEWVWKSKAFARKKDAQEFARKKKDKHHKPYPYIVQETIDRSFFRADVKCEVATKPVDRKIVKY